MMKLAFNRVLVAFFAALVLAGQGTWALAGTTGTLSGIVIDSTTKKPLAGATITAASPSQTVSAKTDAGGHFSILSLSPDTYTVSVQETGYDASSVTGVTVVADNTRELSINADPTLKTIGRVTTRSASALVRPGTTADVYSINAVTQAKVSAAGGGGEQDSAYSALATVPGVSVMPGTAGYTGAGASLSIRGGDYDQIGYEFDGIPVNRAFDNYPAGAVSSLGQQELQAYTGAPPASAVSEGISGFINQVIKQGTSPGFESVTYGEGSPTFYHKLAVELGGETPNRRFSYYAGIGGYNQDFRYADNYNGASLSNLYGTPYGVPCTQTDANGNSFNLSQAVAPSCYNGNTFNNGPYVLGPFNLGTQSSVDSRDTVLNFHYYIPHKDGSRDDFQALYDNSHLITQVYNDTNDLGGVALLNAIGVGQPTYVDGYQLKLPTGGFLPSNYQQYASQYYFPNVPTHQFDSTVPVNQRDGFTNDQDIVKLQYTKSLGTNAYARLDGYTFYSDWLNTGANSTYLDYEVGSEFGVTPDYELESHSRGVDFTLADQINPQNLLNFGFNYVKASVVRSNNTEFLNGLYGPNSVNTRTAIGVLVDSSNPTNGLCYSSTGVSVPCFSTPTGLNGGAGGAQFATLQQAYNGTVAPITAPGCGNGACQYLVIGNGQYATYNNVTPQFYGASLTDEFRPSSKLTVNLGLRLDDYQFIDGNTTGVPQTFFYNAYNAEVCENNVTKALQTKTQLKLATSDNCPSGYSATNFTNPATGTQTYPVFEPRIGFTYTVDPTTVFRASYGRFAQPPNSAFEQYNQQQTEAPSSLYGNDNFQTLGFTTPNHNIPPATSNNYDFSIEHQFPGQVAVKITPFIRKTQNQIEQFFLYKPTNFVSGLNVGNQTSRGVEFELDKGNFAQNGLAAKLSFTYTNNYIQYNTLANGTTVLSPIVDAINTFNGFTKAGGGSACYTVATATTAGVAAPCSSATVANPYYNLPIQSTDLFSPGHNTVPYDLPPVGEGDGASAIGGPFVASLVLNEKINKLSITPIVQMFAGQRYGLPLSANGFDPSSCTGTVSPTTAGDPRYTGPATGGAAADYSTCGNQLIIPDSYTNTFDGLGAFSQPTQILLHMQLSYDVAKNFSLTANAVNIFNGCVGGTKAPWTVKGACGYTSTNGFENGGVGNLYNPGQGIQPNNQYSYSPIFSQQPFGLFVNANFKI